MSVEFERNFLDQIVAALEANSGNGDYYYEKQYGLGSWTFEQMGPRVAFAGDAQLFLTNFFVNATIGNQEYTLPLAGTELNE
ncbi:MAG: hypothetical protein H6766_04365 [Candidatus Peribacteria bacterium]|nr:MAG: hypothetical protein H6766_04365 [Candidatus Peribacteria bacterium]